MPVKRFPLRGPFHGIVTDLPPTVDDLGFEDIVNFISWKGRLRIRPGLNLAGKATPPNGEFPLNMTSFIDAEGFLHTVVLTNLNPYMITAGLVFNVLTYPRYIQSLTLDAPGSGYTVLDTLNIIQSGGVGGTATVVAITGIGDIAAGVLNAPGSGYAAGDIVNVIQGSASTGQFEVLTITGGGSTGPIGTIALVVPGSGYITGTGEAVTGGTGFGATIDITANVLGAISQIELDDPGDGYTTASGLPTSGGTGTGATVDIIGTQLISLGGLNATGLPYAVVKAQNRVFFCNGSVPVSYIDGEAGFKIDGNVPGACRYLTINANHLIGAFWTEPDPTQSGAVNFPQRVRWTDSNNLTEWGIDNPAFTSGVADLLNTPDSITGLTTLGSNSMVYRTNGVSIMQPTGIASEPFYIPNYSLAPKGEGCPWPYSIVTYKNVDYFIGNYDVYMFDGTNFNPLMDGKCNGKFFMDLNGATGQGQVRGMITNVLDNGFTYLAYVITIAGTGVSWILNIPDGTWQRLKWAPGGTTGYFDLQFIEQVYLT